MSSGEWITEALDDRKFAETFLAYTENNDEYQVGTRMVLELLAKSGKSHIKV
jgi:hypothetical protein